MGARGQVTTPTGKLRDAVRDRGWSEEELAWVLDLPVEVCLERLGGRGARPVPPHAVRRQHRELHRALPTLGAEGFSAVHAIDSAEEADAAQIERAPRGSAGYNAMSRRNRARRDDARSSNRHRNA